MNQEIDPFTRAYIVAALWAGLDDDDEPLDKNYSPQDLDPKALSSMMEDCRKFQTENAALMVDLDPEQCGHDFLLTRNGHGTGFWDRDLGELGKELTKVSRQFREFDLYVGDDGKLYV